VGLTDWQSQAAAELHCQTRLPEKLLQQLHLLLLQLLWPFGSPLQWIGCWTELSAKLLLLLPLHLMAAALLH